MSELVQRTTSSLSSWSVQKTGIRLFYLDHKLSGQKGLVFLPMCLCYGRDIQGLSSSTELLLELKQLSKASVMPLKLKIYTRWHVSKLVSSHLEQHSLISAFSFKKSAVPRITNGEALCALPWATQPRDGIHLKSAAETAIASVSHWEGLTQVWPPSPSAQAPRQNSLPTALWCSQLPEGHVLKGTWFLGLWEAEYNRGVLIIANSQFLLKQLQQIYTAASSPP